LYVKNFNVFFKFYFIFYCVLVRVTVYVGCLSGVLNDDIKDFRLERRRTLVTAGLVGRKIGYSNEAQNVRNKT